MRYVHGTFAVLILLFVVIPFQLTIGKLWQPKDRWLWKWVGEYFTKYLPTP